MEDELDKKRKEVQRRQFATIDNYIHHRTILVGNVISKIFEVISNVTAPEAIYILETIKYKIHKEGEE